MSASQDVVDGNPVARVIVRRTIETSAASLVALVILKKALPPEVYRRIVRSSGPALTGALSAYFLATFNPRTRFPGDRFLSRLPESHGRGQIALTFDDGPHPETTPRLLDALALTKQHGASTPATFFVVAERARRYPHLVRRIAEEGHAIGLHGLRHRTLVLDTADRIERDLADAARSVEDALGAALPHRLFRPPYGFKSWTLARTTALLGWTTVGWSCDSRDYAGITSEEIVGRLRPRVRPGDIVLLHERPGASETIDAVPDIVRLCAERSLECIKLALGSNV